LVILTLALAANAFGVDLVRDGKPTATIVVAPGASKAVQFAGQELQAIVQQVTGARLPVANKLPGGGGTAVLLGVKAANLGGKDVLAAADLGDVSGDGYVIAPMPEHKPPVLAVVSREPRGVLYGVYELLERYAKCGFFCDGDFLPKAEDLTVLNIPLSGNPAHEIRVSYVDTRFYGPKRFQATLWNAEDWKRYLRWMARRKFNCLAVNMTADSGAWGEAFENAFPQAKKAKAETMTPRGLSGKAPITARMGWGQAPSHVTGLMKEALTYARETLGLRILYVFAYGQFDSSLQRAQPDLTWLAPSPASVEGSAGQSVWLAATDAKSEDLQTRLWQSVVRTYGKADNYLIFCRPDADPTPKWAPDAVGKAIKVLDRVDPDGAVALSTTERKLWGETVTDRLEFLRNLPASSSVFYLTTRAPDVSPLRGDRFTWDDHRRRAYSRVPPTEVDNEAANVARQEVNDLPHYLPALVVAFEMFAGRPYWYGCAWSQGPAHDLFENRFDILLYHSLHRRYTPAKRRATGFCNWMPLRGSNPLMEHLAGEFAWRGYNVWRSEGASDNRFTRDYFERRYGISEVSGHHPAPLALKAAVRGAPMGQATRNYRSYLRWAEVDAVGAPDTREAIQMMLRMKEEAKDSPLYELDVMDLGRNYLHQVLFLRTGAAVALVESAKEAAKAGKYSARERNENLKKLAALEKDMLAAQKTLGRLVATRRDMCLDEAILEATKVEGANKNLAEAIREQQSGAFADGLTLVDSIEFHQQLKPKQLEHFLQYAQQELTKPTDKPVPSWRQFTLHGTSEFIQAQPVPYEQKAEKTPPSDILKEHLKSAG
jgi:hypothetical protein